MADDIEEDFDAESEDDVSMEDDSPAEESEASTSEITVDYSLASKNKEREELDRQIAEFLARGGKIDKVESNVCADPPQKPSSNYGSRPI